MYLVSPLLFTKRVSEGSRIVNVTFTIVFTFIYTV